MIKIDDLREFRPVYQYEDGEYVTLDAVKGAISEAAQNLDVPVAFYRIKLNPVICLIKVLRIVL